MKRFVPLVLAFFLAMMTVPDVSAAAAAKKPDTKTKTPSLGLATLASQVTGIAISPLLGLRGVWAYQYFKASTPAEKAALPWFAQVSFWLPALLLIEKGVFFPEVLGFDKPAAKVDTLLLLLSRYYGHEDLFARTYHISGTCDVGLCKVRGWIRETFGFGAKKQLSSI